MFFFRRIIRHLLITAVLGFVIRKLLASDNDRAQRVGRTANRFVGGAFGLDSSGHPIPRRRRRGIARSAGSALVGGAFSYFFDRERGYDRRARAKAFATQKLHGNGSASLPSSKQDVSTPAATTGAGNPTV